MKNGEKLPLRTPHEIGIPEITLVALSDDPRAAELVALFNKADDRGKHCLLAMARVMPCMRGG